MTDNQAQANEINESKIELTEEELNAGSGGIEGDIVTSPNKPKAVGRA